jgi:hypothetical protein
VVVNPPLRRGSPIHAPAFRALRDLQADQVRFVPWLPYPRLAVAELEGGVVELPRYAVAVVSPGRS